MNASLVDRLCALAILVTVSGAVWPQAGTSDFPNRHVTIVVPYSPGGATDTQTRIVAAELSALLKQPVTVENRPGGAAAVGMAYLARAKPDGYIFGMSDISPLANSPHIQRKLPFDPLKDFDPIVLIATTDLVLVVPPSLGISSVQQLIQLLKNKPKSLDYASYGIGSISHLAAELFMSMAKVEMIHVPYSGSTAAFADLIPGRVPIMFSIMPPTVGHIKGGKLQALGVTGSGRNNAIPDVPPIAEAGVPGYNATSWFVFLLPAGAPKEVVARLNSEINKVLANPAIKKRFAELGLSIEGGTAEKASAHIRSEFEKWRQVVRDAGIKPED